MKLIETDGNICLDDSDSGSCSMPQGAQIVPDEYLALHSKDVICSLLITPQKSVRPWLVVGTNQGDILFYPADVNHTEKSHKISRERVHQDSPIEAIACGDLTGAYAMEIVTICADGTLSTFTPPLKEGDGPCLNYQQLIQANVRAAYIMDVDGDGKEELVIILTDRVVRTYRYSIKEKRLLAINKWEVPCQITGYGIGAYNNVTQSVDLILSQMGASYFISLPLSGKDTVDLVHQTDNKSPSVMMLPTRTKYAGIMGSMMHNLAIRGRNVPPFVKERPLENTGFPIIGACTCIASDGLELVATIDIRGMILLYVVPPNKTSPESKEPNKAYQHSELLSVAYFETDESCEYMTMTAIDSKTVMMSVANIFRHLFLYKINLADIDKAIPNQSNLPRVL